MPVLFLMHNVVNLCRANKALDYDNALQFEKALQFDNALRHDRQRSLEI